MKPPRCCICRYESWHKLQRKYGLTKRELLTAIYICQGYKAKWIARKMDITYSTAKTHKRNVKNKVGVRNDIQILNRFIEDLQVRDLWH